MLLNNTSVNNTKIREREISDIARSVILLSLNHINSNYTGNAIKLRRSSDNAELDFGFVNGEIDYSSINTWLGGDTAYVVTWYDQSGNNNNASQTFTQSRQPTLDTTNKKIIFTGSSVNELRITDNDTIKPQGGDFSLCMKVNLLGYENFGSSVNSPLVKNTGTFAANSYGYPLDNNNRMYFKTGGGAGTTLTQLSSDINNVRLYTGRHKEYEGQQIYVDTSLRASGSATNPISDNTGDMYLGGDAVSNRSCNMELYGLAMFKHYITDEEINFINNNI